MLRRTRSKSGDGGASLYGHVGNGAGSSSSPSSSSLEIGYGGGVSYPRRMNNSGSHGSLSVSLHLPGTSTATTTLPPLPPAPSSASKLQLTRTFSGSTASVSQSSNSSSSSSSSSGGSISSMKSHGAPTRRDGWFSPPFKRKPSIRAKRRNHNSSNNNYHDDEYYSPASIMEEKENKTPKSPSTSTSFLLQQFASLTFWTCIMAVAFGTLAFHYAHQKYEVLEQVRDVLQRETGTMMSLTDISDAHERLQMRLDAGLKETRTLREAMREVDNQKRKMQDQLAALIREQEERLPDPTTREEEWKSQVLLLQQATQRESKRAVLEKFGPGPHQVEFAVALPRPDGGRNTRYLVLEMAPLDVMPHAIHLFLEQVSHRLWNGARFYINGPHVLQAGPQPPNEGNAEQQQQQEDERSLALKPFRDLQLQTLAFPEYSDAFPHVPWTMGYTGRPGGPDFYINKVDNSLAHGPGGQHHHAIHEFADPCFAKVIRGFETLAGLSRLETARDDPEFSFFLREPVELVSAVILTRPISAEQREVPPDPRLFETIHHEMMNAAAQQQQLRP